MKWIIEYYPGCTTSLQNISRIQSILTHLHWFESCLCQILLFQFPWWRNSSTIRMTWTRLFQAPRHEVSDAKHFMLVCLSSISLSSAHEKVEVWTSTDCSKTEQHIAFTFPMKNGSAQNRKSSSSRKWNRRDSMSWPGKIIVIFYTEWSYAIHPSIPCCVRTWLNPSNVRIEPCAVIVSVLSASTVSNSVI